MAGRSGKTGWTGIQGDHEFFAQNAGTAPEGPVRAFFHHPQRERYKIKPLANIECDFLQFEHWMLEGLQEQDLDKAYSLLTQGIHLYQGDFLPDMNPSQIADKKEYFREIFLRGIRTSRPDSRAKRTVWWSHLLVWANFHHRPDVGRKLPIIDVLLLSKE